MLAMGTFIKNPCTRVTILWTEQHTNVDFSSKCWFGTDVGDGHFYRESLCENDNSMKQETHKCRFFFQMLIWRWRWRCGSVKENPCARMRIPCQVLIKKVVVSSQMLTLHWMSWIFMSPQISESLRRLSENQYRLLSRGGSTCEENVKMIPRGRHAIPLHPAG